MAAMVQATTVGNGISERVLAAYRARTPQSSRFYERASKALSGGTTGNLRHFHPYPLYFETGNGSRAQDVDGNEYIDCFLCNGPLLLGHRHPAIMDAMREHARIGSLVVNPPIATEVAEQIRQAVACAERVRFLNSGTEAVLTAVRMARAYTGKNKVVKFFGHYHGQDDQFLVGLGPDRAPFGAGVPASAYEATEVIRYGDADELATLLAKDRDIAAVLLDPAMHSGGLWGSSVEYLREARRLTEKHGVVLIFDEVITGFRLAHGGAQAHYGVTPDLATFGKALAAGERLSAVAGLAKIMAVVGPGRGGGAAMFQSGTGNDGTAALAAARAALGEYRGLDASGAYALLEERAVRLAKGIREAFSAHGIACHVNQLGSMLQLFLADGEPGFERFSKLDTSVLALFYLALINESALLSLPTSNHIYLSFAHSDADVDALISKIKLVLDKYDFRTLVGAGGALA